MSATDRRRALIEAAVRVMIREGVGSVTTRAVVAEAGMTLGAFHYCFASKQELLREVTAVVIENEFRAGLASVRPGTDTRRMIGEALGAYLRVVRERPEEQQVLFELTQYALRTPGQGDLAGRQYAVYRQAAEKVLERFAEVAMRHPVRAVLLRYVQTRASVLRPRSIESLINDLLPFVEFLTSHHPEVNSLRGL
jgi:AcrR family transcriptional regulator